AHRNRHGRQYRSCGRNTESNTSTTHGAAPRSRSCRCVSYVRQCQLHYPSSSRCQRRTMLMHRVVVTGMGGISALGSDWPTIQANFQAGHNAVCTMREWDKYTELNTRLAAPIKTFTTPSHWTRKQLRSMGRVSQL